MSKCHLDGQTTTDSINSLNRSAVHSHRAFGDRQAEAGAATTLPVACILGAIERTKDLLERFFRNAPATITHANHRVAILSLQRNLDRRSLRRVTNRVAHDILNRAAQ